MMHRKIVNALSLGSRAGEWENIRFQKGTSAPDQSTFDRNDQKSKSNDTLVFKKELVDTSHFLGYTFLNKYILHKIMHGFGVL